MDSRINSSPTAGFPANTAANSPLPQHRARNGTADPDARTSTSSGPVRRNTSWRDQPYVLQDDAHRIPRVIHRQSQPSLPDRLDRAITELTRGRRHATQSLQSTRNGLLREVMAATLDLRSTLVNQSHLQLAVPVLQATHALAADMEADIETVILPRHLHALPENCLPDGVRHLVIPDYAGRELDLRALGRDGTQAPRVLLLNPARLQTIRAHAHVRIDQHGAGQAQIVRSNPAFPHGELPDTVDTLGALRRDSPQHAAALSAWLTENALHAYVFDVPHWGVTAGHLFTIMLETGVPRMAAQLLTPGGQLHLTFETCTDDEQLAHCRIIFTAEGKGSSTVDAASPEQVSMLPLHGMLPRDLYIEHFGTGEGCYSMNVWPTDIARYSTDAAAVASTPRINEADRAVYFNPQHLLGPQAGLLANAVRTGLLEIAIRTGRIDMANDVWRACGLDDMSRADLLLASEPGRPGILGLALQGTRPELVSWLIEQVDQLDVREYLKVEILWAGRADGEHMASGFEQACCNPDPAIATAYLSALQLSSLGQSAKDILMSGKVRPVDTTAAQALLRAGKADALANAALAINGAQLPAHRRLALLTHAYDAIESMEQRLQPPAYATDELVAAHVLAHLLPGQATQAHGMEDQAEAKSETETDAEPDTAPGIAQRRAALLFKIVAESGNPPAHAEESLFQ